MDWRDASLGGNVGPGWVPLVDELHRKVQEIVPDVHVVQVKEKFGGLRYYIGSVPEDKYEQVYALIRGAETLSYKTCEECGEPGTSDADKGYWLKTLCTTHRRERRLKHQ